MFHTFDTDRNLTIEKRSIIGLVNASLREMGVNETVSLEDIRPFLDRVCFTYDGRLLKTESYRLFKDLAHTY